MSTYSIKIEHPWQNGPTELIAHGLEHMHLNTDFDQRIAFLLFDVGVETLFKTALLLPERITGAKTSYGDRRRAVEGGFHNLIQGVELARPDLANKYNLAHIQFYHDKRNQLYHEGNGITIDIAKTREYARLTVDLLNELLHVDLADLLHAPEQATMKREAENRRLAEIETKKSAMVMARSRATYLARVVLDYLAPAIASENFYRTLAKKRELSPKAAKEYLTDVVHRSFADRDMSEMSGWYGSISVGNLLADHNLLNIIITAFLEDMRQVPGLYVISGYDPENIYPGVEPIYQDGGKIDGYSAYDFEMQVTQIISHYEELTDELELFSSRLQRRIDRLESDT